MHRKSVTVVFAASMFISACSSTALKPGPSSGIAAASNVGAPSLTDAQQSINQSIRTLTARSIFFDYDNYTLKPEYQDLLKDDSKLMTAAPSLFISVEGNADERGSREYNLALGQKRAEAVKKALLMLGVPEARMEAISYGEERPRATCAEEKCWSENRRADIAAKQGAARK